VRAALRPVCGRRTAWTPPQKRAVADTITAHAAEPGMRLLAPEWRRLDRQVATCRGEA
jgi:hypothetical protein